MANYPLPDPRMENPAMFLPWRKPIGAVRVKENAYTDGMTLAYFPGQRSFIRPGQPTPVNGATVQAKGANGWSAVGDGSNGAIDFGFDVIHSGKLSIIAGISTTTASGIGQIFTGDASSVNKRDWQFRLNNGAVQFIPFVGGSNGSVISSGTVSVNTPTVVGCTHDNIAASNNIKTFINGVNDGMSSKSGHLDSDSPRLGALARFFDNTIAASEGFSGHIYFLYVWGNRFLSDYEHYKIAKNPYNTIFEPV